MPEFRPELMLAALNDHQVRYVLIGGLAAVLHGSALPTYDVNITPDASAENLARLSDALRFLDARVRVDATSEGVPFDHDATSLAGLDTLNLVTRAGELDIAMRPAGIPDYAAWAGDATTIEVLGVSVPVASLRSVLTSKAAADRPKDRLALPMLRELLRRSES